MAEFIVILSLPRSRANVVATLQAKIMSILLQRDAHPVSTGILVGAYEDERTVSELRDGFTVWRVQNFIQRGW